VGFLKKFKKRKKGKKLAKIAVKIKKYQLATSKVDV